MTIAAPANATAGARAFNQVNQVTAAINSSEIQANATHGLERALMSERSPTHDLIMGKCRPKSPTFISLMGGTETASGEAYSNTCLASRRNLRSITWAHRADKKECESPKKAPRKGQKTKKA